MAYGPGYPEKFMLLKLLLLFVLKGVLSSILVPFFDWEGIQLTIPAEQEMSKECALPLFQCAELKENTKLYEPFLELVYGQPWFGINEHIYLSKKITIPAEVLYVALNRLINVDDIDVTFVETALIDFVNNFEAGWVEIIQIFDVLFEKRLYKKFAKLFLKWVSKFNVQLGYEIGNNLGTYIIEKDLIKDQDHPIIPYIVGSSWFNLQGYIGLMSNCRLRGSLALFLGQRFLVDAESTNSLILSMEYIHDDYYPLLRWLISQPWINTELLEIFSDHQLDEDFILDVCMNRAANFKCMKNLFLRSCSHDDQYMELAVKHLLGIIKRDCNEDDIYGYMVSTGAYSRWEKQHFAEIFKAFPAFFLPIDHFSGKLLKDSKAPWTSLSIISVYLDTFGEDMKKTDLDTITELLFKLRPFDLEEMVVEINLVAEKILKHSSATRVLEEDHLETLRSFHSLPEEYKLRYIESGELDQNDLVFLLQTNSLPGKTYMSFLRRLEPFNVPYYESARAVLDLSFADNIRQIKSLNSCLRMSQHTENIMVNWDKLVQNALSLWGMPGLEKYCQNLTDNAKKILNYPGIDKLKLTHEAIALLHSVAHSRTALRGRIDDPNEPESAAKRQNR